MPKERRIHDLFFKSSREQNAQRVIAGLGEKRSKNSTGILSPKDHRELEANRLLLRRATRRQALAWIGAVGGVGALTAVGVLGAERLGGTRNEEYHVPTHEDLLRSFDDLPPSIVKDLLVERIKPFFSENPPERIDRSGIPINVQKPILSIISTDTGNTIGGSAISINTKEDLTIADTQTRDIPYIGALTDQELRDWKNGIFQDGSPSVRVEWNAGNTIIDGITPQIELRLPSPALVDLQEQGIKDSAMASNKWLFIKEASTLLLFDLAFDELAAKMIEQEQDPFIDVIDKNGVRQKHEIVTDSVRLFASFLGRFHASLDIGGALLAVQAVTAGGDDPPFFKYDTKIFRIYSDIKSLRLGASAAEVYKSTMKWSGLDPKADFFPHPGRRQDLP